MFAENPESMFHKHHFASEKPRIIEERNKFKLNLRKDRVKKMIDLKRSGELTIEKTACTDAYKYEFSDLDLSDSIKNCTNLKFSSLESFLSDQLIQILSASSADPEILKFCMLLLESDIQKYLPILKKNDQLSRALLIQLDNAFEYYVSTQINNALVLYHLIRLFTHLLEDRESDIQAIIYTDTFIASLHSIMLFHKEDSSIYEAVINCLMVGLVSKSLEVAGMFEIFNATSKIFREFRAKAIMPLNVSAVYNFFSIFINSAYLLSSEQICENFDKLDCFSLIFFSIADLKYTHYSVIVLIYLIIRCAKKAGQAQANLVYEYLFNNSTEHNFSSLMIEEFRNPGLFADENDLLSYLSCYYELIGVGKFVEYYTHETMSQIKKYILSDNKKLINVSIHMLCRLQRYSSSLVSDYYLAEIYKVCMMESRSNNEANAFIILIYTWKDSYAKYKQEYTELFETLNIVEYLISKLSNIELETRIICGILEWIITREPLKDPSQIPRIKECAKKLLCNLELKSESVTKIEKLICTLQIYEPK